MPGNVNNAFVVNTDGSVIPLKNGCSKKENLGVAVLSHFGAVHNLISNKYRCQQITKNLEKALWLGNSSVMLYTGKRNRMRVISATQIFLVQTYLEVDFEIVLSPRTIYLPHYDPVRKSQ